MKEERYKRKKKPYKDSEAMKLIVYRIAAWMIGGTVHQFEGRDGSGRWHRGICILSHDALVAHRVCFRTDAMVYVDTALVDP